MLFFKFLRGLFDLDGRFRKVGRPARVCFLAGISVWAKATEIELTWLFPNMSLRANRP